MKQIVAIVLLYCCTANLSYAFTLNAPNKTAVTDGSQSDVAAAIGSASVVDGWTVTLPHGDFTWTSGVTISGKGIKVQGAGSGRVIGRSNSSVAVGMGAKTFTTQSGLPIITGQVLRIERPGTAYSAGRGTGVRAYMVGTVSSYLGTTLTINVTNTGGSGTHPVWIISSEAQTTVNYATNSTLFTITEDATHHVELSGIKFLWDSAAGQARMIVLQPTAGGKPVLIHDNYFELDEGSEHTAIWSQGPRGLVYKNSFAAFPWSESAQPIVIYASGYNAWTSTSTMGADDSTGTANFYIEENDFHWFLNSMDLDDNARAVVRYNTFNNAGVGTHGADTSNYGVRHFELYNNNFIFNGYGDGNTANLNYLVFIRGGTGVITNNVMPDIASPDYDNKNEVVMTVMNLQRAGGPNACFGANVAGVQYPVPRQVGMGRVTGGGVDGAGRSSDTITYVGDSEPLYIWGNSRTPDIDLSDYGGSDCVNPDSTTEYVVLNRNYYVGTAKPNWSPYTYPHPLRSPTPPSMIPSAPSNLVVQ